MCVAHTLVCVFSLFFFFNDTATTEIYTPYTTLFRSLGQKEELGELDYRVGEVCCRPHRWPNRSEEHTTALQSRSHLVCRLLLENTKTVFALDPRNHRSALTNWLLATRSLC